MNLPSDFVSWDTQIVSREKAEHQPVYLLGVQHRMSPKKPHNAESMVLDHFGNSI